MPKTYDRAPPELLEVLADTIERYHPGLHETNARVEVLLCHAAEGSDTPAVTLRGRKCYAVVSILNLKSRVAGRGDAEIVIDGDNWESWSPAKLAAILDHELTHLELERTSGGESWKTDDAGRPKMTLRQHDIEVGWFDCVARRHGLHSIEVEQATQLIVEHEEFVQLYLPGFEIRDGEPVIAGEFPTSFIGGDGE